MKKKLTVLKKSALPDAPSNFKPRDARGGSPALPGTSRFRPRFQNDDDDIPLDAEPLGSSPPPPPFAQVLEGVLQKLKMRVSPVAELLRAEWDTLLPPDLAPRCRPGKLLGHVLYVHVPDSTTLFLLRPQLSRIEAALMPKLAEARVKHVRLLIDAEAFA